MEKRERSGFKKFFPENFYIWENIYDILGNCYIIRGDYGMQIYKGTICEHIREKYPVLWDDMGWRAERIKFGDTRRTWVSTRDIKNDHDHDYGLVSFWKEHSINVHYRPWRQKGRAKGQWLCLMNDIAKKLEKYKKFVELHCYNVGLKIH